MKHTDAEMKSYPTLVNATASVAGLFILVETVFGFNILGDALRDVADPRLRGSR